MNSPKTTVDCKDQLLMPGDSVRILDITPDPDMDEDDHDLFMDMIGATCEIERIDADGAAWVAIWWNCSDGNLTTQVGLMPRQMEKVSAN